MRQKIQSFFSARSFLLTYIFLNEKKSIYATRFFSLKLSFVSSEDLCGDPVRHPGVGVPEVDVEGRERASLDPASGDVTTSGGRQVPGGLDHQDDQAYKPTTQEKILGLVKLLQLP